MKALFAAAVLLAVTALAPHAAAATFTVNTASDSHAVNLASGDDGTGHVSLRSAIEAANNQFGSQLINLPPNTYNLSLGELKLGNTNGTVITLNGTGAAAATTLNQTSSSNRLFNIDYNFHGGVTVTLQNVTLQNGTGGAGGGGGAILDGDAGDVLTVSNAVFNGNKTSAFNGGAISWTGGGTLNVFNCTFTNNSSPTGNGGAIHFLQTQAGGLTISNSTFHGNSATGGSLGGQGGACNLGASIASPFVVVGCMFSNNTAVLAGTSGGQGGAIMLGAGTATLVYNRFVNNHAPGGGTAVFHGGVEAAGATNNWWGANGGPNTAGADTTSNTAGSLSTSPFLRLTHAASPGTVLTNGVVTLTARFTTNSAGAPVAASNLGALVGLPITFNNPIKGALSSPQGVIQVSGTATATFTAGSAAGAGSADAIVDNATVTAGITIVVPPVANSQSVAVVLGTPKAITLTGNDPNTPTLPLTYLVTAQPAHGALTGSAPNLTYTAGAGYTGADSFQFKVNNGVADSGPATVAAVVVANNAANSNRVQILHTTTPPPPANLLVFEGKPGQLYVVQSASVVTGPWTDLSPPIAADATGWITYADPNPSAPRFYRVRQ